MITTACEATYKDVIYRVDKINNACKQILNINFKTPRLPNFQHNKNVKYFYCFT